MVSAWVTGRRCVSVGRLLRGLSGEGALRWGDFPIEVWGNVRRCNGEVAQMWGGSCVSWWVKVRNGGAVRAWLSGKGA